MAASGALLGTLALLSPPLISGCQSAYLIRQASGAIGVARNRAPIDGDLLDRLDPRDRNSLEWISRVREYASREMDLDTGSSYTTYLDTGGAPISTIVVAAHPLALEPYRWHFPIVGTVPYKGFFDPAEADAEAARLRKSGWDAARYPVQAFSFLGWFGDPVLSTMLELPRGKLADLIIHELTHRTIYIPDRSEVNESLATAVAREGTKRLLASDFGENSPEYREYIGEIEDDDLLEGFLDRLRKDLDALYRSSLPREGKLERKAELFATASRALRNAGLGPGIGPSNARIVLEREYHSLVPFFLRVMSALGGPRGLIERLKEPGASGDPLDGLDPLSIAPAPPGSIPRSPEHPCAPSTP